jgi:molybdopterin-guanine dinucleotide biosynthesis protein A
VAAEETIVAVLAGGAGRRLGEDKPCAKLAGAPLIARPLGAARAAGLDAIVVAKPRTRLPDLDAPVVFEPDEPTHPLCGVLAALRYSLRRPRPPAVIAVACDMPFVTGGLLSWLAARRGAVLAYADGRPQPLLARWPANATEQVQAALHAQLSLAATLAALSPQVVGEEELSRFGEPGRLCFSVNDGSDLRLAASWLGPQPGPRSRAQP